MGIRSSAPRRLGLVVGVYLDGMMWKDWVNVCVGIGYRSCSYGFVTLRILFWIRCLVIPSPSTIPFY